MATQTPTTVDSFVSHEDQLRLTAAAMSTETPAELVGRFAMLMTEDEFASFTFDLLAEWAAARDRAGSVEGAFAEFRDQCPVGGMFVAAFTAMLAEAA